MTARAWLVLAGVVVATIAVWPAGAHNAGISTSRIVIRGRAHAVGVRLGERRQGLARLAGIFAHDRSLACEPRRPREVDGVYECGFLGVVRVQESRGHGLGLGDLPFKLAETQANELEGIEHETLVEARLEECETRARS